MSDQPETFEGGEPPCSEGAIRDREEAPLHESNPLNDTAGFSAGGGKGVTAEELNDLFSQVPPEMLAPDLPMLLASMAAMLEEQAWRHLGLVANPVTHKVEKDLQKAKIAIDIVAYITSQVSPLVGDSQRRDLQNKVSTLQINFVEQSRQG